MQFSDEEKSDSDFADDPYDSPELSSENDEVLDDLDFSNFCQSVEASDPQTTPNQSSESWCMCGLCSCCSGNEAVCCHSKDELTYLMDGEQCITLTNLFNGLLSEGLEYSRFIHASAIRSTIKRQEYLAKEMTNGLRRHLLYRNFVLVMNSGRPLGKHNRVVLPKCVVDAIRHKYPESNENDYTGFIDPVSVQEE